ncbi:MAG TPA: DUF6682 family protein [Steroidobacter sp.]
MTLYAEPILADVRQTLQDEGSTRKWSDVDLVGYGNEGVRTIALFKPDATAKTATIALAAGTRQLLPADGLRLIKLTRNMGADGNTPGRPVHVADAETLARFAPDWHTRVGVDEIENYAYDENDPKVFWVFPPAKAGRRVEGVYSAVPAAMDAAGLNYDNPVVVVPLDDVYEAVLKAWMLRCAFGVEISSITSQRLATRYEQSFASMLGIKWRIDMFVSPNQQQPKSEVLT